MIKAAILNPDADLPALHDEVMQKSHDSFLQREDEIIKKAFTDKGFACTEDFIKAHCCIVDDGKFRHIWYHFGEPDAVRIVSFEKEMQTRIEEADGTWKFTIEQKYY
jgi:tRNA U34 2-thiouridine synthase MnmA/TrmU